MNQHASKFAEIGTWPGSFQVETAIVPAASIIAISGLSKSFGKAAAPVLDNISLSIAKGSIHGIIGRSGAGKSTLVRCLNGLVEPTAGQVVVAGREITQLRGRTLRIARHDIAMIFQHFSLLSSRTAAGNIALPMEIAGVAKDVIRKRVPELLELVGLTDKATAYPAELSGGQKQRIGIARALALEPAVLLSDEATSALDPETTEQILQLLKDINRRTGITIVLITHEMDVVRQIADHVTVLEAGKVAESGATFDVFAFPKSKIARSFLSSVVAHDLPREVTAQLRTVPGPDRDPVLRIIFTGAAAQQPIVALLVEKFGIRPNILHGRIDYIAGKPLGIMTLIAENGGDRMEALLRFLRIQNLQGEVIGYAERTAFTGIDSPAV